MVATPITTATANDESIRHMGDVTSDLIRMQRVKNKLDSVLVWTYTTCVFPLYDELKLKCCLTLGDYETIS